MKSSIRTLREVLHRQVDQAVWMGLRLSPFILSPFPWFAVHDPIERALFERIPP